MGKRLELPFDPIDRAARIWENRFGPSPSMAAVTSIMRAQQILLAELDALLRPYQLTFARYEALVLLTFSRRGALPLRVIGERLMVHPTSVTNIISRSPITPSGSAPRRLKVRSTSASYRAKVSPYGRSSASSSPSRSCWARMIEVTAAIDGEGPNLRSQICAARSMGSNGNSSGLATVQPYGLLPVFSD